LKMKLWKKKSIKKINKKINDSGKPRLTCQNSCLGHEI